MSTTFLTSKELSARHPESRLYKALREVGRIDKTLFLLNYISDLALRRRVLGGCWPRRS